MKQSSCHKLLGLQTKWKTLPKVEPLLKKQLFLNILKLFFEIIIIHITVLITAVKPGHETDDDCQECALQVWNSREAEVLYTI